jgi:hypothetical protein
MTGSFAVKVSEEDVASISFPLPLPNAVPLARVLGVNPGQTVEHCGGSPGEPKADAGYICIYVGPSSGYEVNARWDPATQFGPNGQYKYGVFLPAGGEIGETAGAVFHWFMGTYAATACGGTEFPCP